MPTNGQPSTPREAPSENVSRTSRLSWIRVADVATLSLLCAAAWVVVTGGMRTSIDGVRVSVTSPVRLVLLGLAIGTVRHAFRRRPSLIDAVLRTRPRRVSAAWAATAPVWAVSRVSVILAGYFAVLVIGFPGRPPFSFFENSFANLPARWDTGWYVDIAANGYQWRDAARRQQNVAFFPAFPLTMQLGGALLGACRPGILQLEAQRRMLIAGWLVALATFWFALVYVYRWSEARAGPSVAKATITLLAAYPFAVFFSAPYTEPLYLLGAAATFVHFERAEWVRCAGWGFLLGLVRPNGVLVAIPLALIAAQRRRREAPRSRLGIGVWVAVCAPAVALFLHSLYLRQLTGRWFAWSEVHAAWGRTYEVTSWVGQALAQIGEHGALKYVETAPITILNGLAAALALALVWPLTRTAGLAYAVFVLVNLVPAVGSGGLMSVGRLTSTLYPLFFALAASIPERHLPAWTVGFGVLQGLLAVLFFTWRPPF
jgi:Mannosyltransferase (PIG-V)